VGLAPSVFGLGALQLFGVGGAWRGRSLSWAVGVGSRCGIILALSSTAFVLPTLAERRELSTRHGREAFAILLFQDLSVIPLLALIPLGTGKPTALTSGRRAWPAGGGGLCRTSIA
jgi:Kef-type K+ transport system membrane component KefB